MSANPGVLSQQQQRRRQPQEMDAGMPHIWVTAADADGEDARMLMAELEAHLAGLPGGATVRFNPAELQQLGALFVIARDPADTPWGCCALRPHDTYTGEIKRMYARPNHAGVGSLLLYHLEHCAREMAYRRIILHTRASNAAAIRFYEQHGFEIIEPYPPYENDADAVCMAKNLGDGPGLLPY